MSPPIDEDPPLRADMERLDAFCRLRPIDPAESAAMLGLILAEKLMGWRPPWRRGSRLRVPARLVLSLVRRPGAGRPFDPRMLGAAND
ncbi:hypothetical protein [Phenylobacterium sp.]|uniref:hypothetical protein n=1 Tax=Phenylobacterium sp. TaxID=1871053 RepID=UPI0035B39359